jgi:hypothetical protein
MPIRQTSSNFNAESFEEKIKQTCILKLRYIGEECVRQARKHGTYTDRTGNLRSSVGYVIVDNSKIMAESEFRPVKNTTEGGDTGHKYARRLANRYPKGIALIVVAGMKYAVYVQRRGHDVTASAELLAERLLSQLKINAKLMHL